MSCVPEVQRSATPTSGASEDSVPFRGRRRTDWQAGSPRTTLLRPPQCARDLWDRLSRYFTSPAKGREEAGDLNADLTQGKNQNTSAGSLYARPAQ